MCNSVLRKRLKKIQTEERHHIDASMITLDLLNIIVKNTESILNSGISLKYITEIGSFLRTKGDKVDFVKLDNWLSSLHIQRMAQLEGSILISVFGFDEEEKNGTSVKAILGLSITIPRFYAGISEEAFDTLTMLP